MNYWKQFRLCKLAKARVIEIFHASKLWYAACFYPIPPPILKTLQKAFFDYVNYPHKNVTVKQEEMHKLHKHGGIKLINIQAKIEASQIKWLINLCVDPELNIHLTLIDRLLGEQKGKCRGKDLFFTTKHYARKVLKIHSPFYKDAIKAMTTLDLRKQVLDPREEKLFYNPIFQGRSAQTLKITKPCETAGVFTYGLLLDEVELCTNGRPHRRHIANLFDRIFIRDLDDRQHYLLNTGDGNFKFEKVTQKLVYEQLLKLNYRDHHSSAKWVLLRIYPSPVTEQERIFGILGNSPAIVLRNWLTYVLRFCIYWQENSAYHNKKGVLNATDIKLIYNAQVHREAVQRLLYYTHIGWIYSISIIPSTRFL